MRVKVLSAGCCLRPQCARPPGISTFANLADADQVDRGLQRLTNDIGAIARVMAHYVSLPLTTNSLSPKPR